MRRFRFPILGGRFLSHEAGCFAGTPAACFPGRFFDRREHIPKPERSLSMTFEYIIDVHTNCSGGDNGCLKMVLKRYNELLPC